jgi:hypothetical protein
MVADMAAKGELNRADAAASTPIGGVALPVDGG